MNKLGLIKLRNSSLTRPSRELEKSSFDRPLVLSHSDFSAQPTNFAQDTRIAYAKNIKIKSKNPYKSFCYFLLSQNEVSPFFIDSALDSQSIRATNRNGRNCGGGFVFVRIFGRETRLGVCECPKILTSAKDAPKSKLNAQAEFVRLWV